MKKTIYYIAGLIALYLVLVHFAGFSSDVGASLKGGTGLITALQGR